MAERNDLLEQILAKAGPNISENLAKIDEFLIYVPERDLFIKKRTFEAELDSVTWGQVHKASSGADVLMYTNRVNNVVMTPVSYGFKNHTSTHDLGLGGVIRAHTYEMEIADPFEPNGNVHLTETADYSSTFTVPFTQYISEITVVVMEEVLTTDWLHYTIHDGNSNAGRGLSTDKLNGTAYSANDTLSWWLDKPSRLTKGNIIHANMTISSTRDGVRRNLLVRRGTTNAESHWSSVLARVATKEDIATETFVHKTLLGQELGNLVMGEVETHSVLPDASTVSGQIYRVRKRTPNYWTLGATSRFLAGYYESDGTNWVPKPNAAMPVYDTVRGDTFETPNYRSFKASDVTSIVRVSSPPKDMYELFKSVTLGDGIELKRVVNRHMEGGVGVELIDNSTTVSAEWSYDLGITRNQDYIKLDLVVSNAASPNNNIFYSRFQIDVLGGDDAHEMGFYILHGYVTPYANQTDTSIAPRVSVIEHNGLYYITVFIKVYTSKLYKLKIRPAFGTSEGYGTKDYTNPLVTHTGGIRISTFKVSAAPYSDIDGGLWWQGGYEKGSQAISKDGTRYEALNEIKNSLLDPSEDGANWIPLGRVTHEKSVMKAPSTVAMPSRDIFNATYETHELMVTTDTENHTETLGKYSYYLSHIPDRIAKIKVRAGTITGNIYLRIATDTSNRNLSMRLILENAGTVVGEKSDINFVTQIGGLEIDFTDFEIPADDYLVLQLKGHTSGANWTYNVTEVRNFVLENNFGVITPRKHIGATEPTVKQLGVTWENDIGVKKVWREGKFRGDEWQYEDGYVLMSEAVYGSNANLAASTVNTVNTDSDEVFPLGNTTQVDKRFKVEYETSGTDIVGIKLKAGTYYEIKATILAGGTSPFNSMVVYFKLQTAGTILASETRPVADSAVTAHDLGFSGYVDADDTIKLYWNAAGATGDKAKVDAIQGFRFRQFEYRRHPKVFVQVAEPTVLKDDVQYRDKWVDGVIEHKRIWDGNAEDWT